MRRVVVYTENYLHFILRDQIMCIEDCLEYYESHHKLLAFGTTRAQRLTMTLSIAVKIYSKWQAFH